ncbi:helix-turn-helix transcriptional regulator [Ornithinibacillus xuwenensis]|uniref:DeoR family transcriptional regulator n=1 Tax=Ornithinibacillus xuwenensis TaxID=3144668 RepID=A0ABU9XJC5_9BACI
MARTKQKLLTILKRNHVMTIEGMMEFFTISDIAVRKHIHELENQGLIRKNAIKKNIGRPAYEYELTQAGNRVFPNHYESLSVDLLKDLEELQGLDAVYSLLERRMEKEVDFFHSNNIPIDFDEKVAKVAELQEDRGYMVELEQKPDGSYEMRHFNCPIANLANAYQQVCKNEHKVFNAVFSDSYVNCVACMTSGDHYCNWTIRNPKDK